MIYSYIAMYILYSMVQGIVLLRYAGEHIPKEDRLTTLLVMATLGPLFTIMIVLYIVNYLIFRAIGWNPDEI